MKKLLSTLALSLSAIMATSAMAAPDHRYDDRRHQASATYKHHDKRWDNPRHHAQWEQKRYDQKRVNPSRDWRVGQNLPRGYDANRYKVSDREARRLPNTGRFQQWYKINGDYVLINERTQRIIRIIG